MKKKKRNRGGQKGNQIARTHGFHASALAPGETCRFLNILNQERLYPDVAVLRLKVRCVSLPDPFKFPEQLLSFLQNGPSVVFPLILTIIAFFSYEKEEIIVYYISAEQSRHGLYRSVRKYRHFCARKRGNQCFLMFYKMIQAWFLPSCPENLPILASKKEKIIDY